MSDFEIVEEFMHNGRLCIVVRGEILMTFHNGYVEARPKRKKYYRVNGEIRLDITYSKYHINTEEPTYSRYGVCGTHEDKYFIGFDSAHHWNTLNPDSTTQTSVKERLKKFADEIIGIEGVDV